MRSVVWLVLLSVVAVVAATTLGRNDGLVSIYWGGWRTDLSLNLAVILLVGLCALFMLAWQAVHVLTTLPRRAGEWRALRKERAAQAELRTALAEYFAARYSRAHKSAARALAIQPDAPELRGDREFAVLAQLLAAASLHRLQDRERRDAMLAETLPRQGRPAGRADDGARLLAAEWALDDRDADAALRLLGELPPGVARRTQALRLRLRAARAARQPMEALRTARMLANHGAFSAMAARGLMRSLAFDALDGAHDLQQLRKVWDQFDSAERRDGFIAARAAQRAGSLVSPDTGRDWLRPYWERLGELEQDEREQVALALVAVVAGIGTDWLPRLEAALARHAHEPAVVAAVGSAFAERQLWGKARKLLEQAAGAAELPAAMRRRAWRQLAQLSLQEGDEARARQCEQAAAALD